MSIKENYWRIVEQIESLKAKRHISYPITIVAVTKTFGPEVVKEAIQAGICHIGENRVQEADTKFSYLQDLSFTRHLIGPLQSNKINKALQCFDVIQSIESLSLAEGISKRLQKTLPVFIEVNTSSETSKHGVKPQEALDFIAKVKELPNLYIEGLMTVGPLTNDEKAIREAFGLLRKIRDEAQKWFTHTLQLSMGMSDDFLLAIEEGSTMIRLGRILFGSRS